MSNDTILVLGGTGKTGRRIAPRLRARGHDVRTAARHGADVAFDWNDPATYDAALAGVGALYLVPPGQQVDFVDEVTALLDRAEAAGVRHVTLLTAREVDTLPPEVPMRAAELHLAGRAGLTHAILRPGWFMQDFDEAFFLPAGGRLAVPSGDGAEAFVHADDIADVAVATLVAPAEHDRAGYTLTGPEALTLADVADRIAKAAGRPVTHDNLPRDAWVEGLVGGGLPADYAELLGMLTARLEAGVGSGTTDDIERVTGHPARSFDDYASSPTALATWADVI